LDATLQIKNAVTRIAAADLVMKGVSDLLSFEVPNSHFAMRRMPPGVWDGRKRLMKKDGSFPAGLTPQVLAYLKSQGIVYKVEDLRVKPEPSLTFKLRSDLIPRPHQAKWAAITGERVRGVGIVGTGGGKSIMQAMTIHARRVPTLVVVPDKGLKEQLTDDFSYWLDAKHGVIGGDLKGDYPVVVVNIHQVPRAKPEQLARFHMLLIDEFHHAAADSYLTLNALTSMAYWRYGMTGTLVRTDSKDMMMLGVLSNILMKKTTSDLIEEGFLVPAHVTIIPHRVKKTSKFSYKEAYAHMAADPEFNALVAKVARHKIREERKQTLILVRQIEHGRLIESMLAGDGVFVSGDDPMEFRQKVKRDFAEKKIRCMIATNIFGEGQDIASIDVLVNARLQESEIQTKQGVGRALRLAKGAQTIAESVALGKSCAEVFDFLIQGNKHLRDHSETRIEHYRSERAFRVTIED